MNRISTLLLPLLIIFAACNEEEHEIEYNINHYFEMNGYYFDTPYGFLKLGDPKQEGQEFALFLSDGDCSIDTNAVDCAYRRNQIRLIIYSPESDNLPSGTYNYVLPVICPTNEVCWEPYNISFVSIMYSSLEFELEELGEDYDPDKVDYGVTGKEGEIKIENLGDNNYKINYEFVTDREQNITGYYEGKLEFFDH
ncbi:hypothetical protein [Chondrinema litorale]|uniref:hypothetical protein n=1 Tax=Chondrinema litorale TaxID=2994555 RepID=UPI0025432377|nr:hypothetical protein [Chondrinema litorale]UZR95026.1 hypothetical protein OQ292_04255 [Chondrinema litorale]